MIIPQEHSIRERIEAAKQETQSSQAHRLVDYLFTHGPAMSGAIAQACAIGNLSAAAGQIRPALEKRGLAIIAELPDPLMQNRFGEASMAHEWRLTVLR